MVWFTEVCNFAHEHPPLAQLSTLGCWNGLHSFLLWPFKPLRALYGRRGGVSRGGDKNAHVAKMCIAKYNFALKSPESTRRPLVPSAVTGERYSNVYGKAKVLSKSTRVLASYSPCPYLASQWEVNTGPCTEMTCSHQDKKMLRASEKHSATAWRSPTTRLLAHSVANRP